METLTETPKHLIVDLHYTEGPESPTESDGWKLYSFSRKHASFKDPNTFFPNDRPDENSIPLGLKRKLDVGTAFILSYYEHSLCRWSLQGEGPQCQFDTAQIAGLLVWEEPVKNLGPKTYEDRRKDAAAFLETYTAWCNGEVYGFLIKDENGKVVDACSGYYDVGEPGKTGVDDMASEIRNWTKGASDVDIEGEAAWLADHHNFTHNPKTEKCEG